MTCVNDFQRHVFSETRFSETLWLQSENLRFLLSEMLFCSRTFRWKWCTLQIEICLPVQPQNLLHGL
jgi:hypothetical protein